MPTPDGKLNVPYDSMTMDERLAAAHRKLETIAVTGTNGKSTTTSMIAAVVAASGEPAARHTTLGGWVDGSPIETQDPVDRLLDTIETAVERGVRTLALEVVSKSLANGMARRWPPNIAVFTNLTRDHLDFHGSTARYLAAKAQLFVALAPGGTAVLNGDDASCALLEDVLKPGVARKRFSIRQPDADLAAARVDCSRRGTRVELVPSPLAEELGRVLQLPILGAVHAENALAAALACRTAGYSGDAIVAGLAGFGGLPGRFEVVGHEPLTIVDYAHTPDGLRGTLEAARHLVDGGALVCVFGCGGNRDQGKRALMGEVAHRLADVVVLTANNPRFEDPADIADDVLRGVRGEGARWHVELDRAAAIERAVATAMPNDVLVIAGKGQQAVEEVRDQSVPMVDADLARAALGRHHVSKR